MAVLVSLGGRMLGWRMGTRVDGCNGFLKVLKDVVVVVVVVGWAASVEISGS